MQIKKVECMELRQLKHNARQTMVTPRKPGVFGVTAIYVIIGAMLQLIDSHLGDPGRWRMAMADWAFYTVDAVARTGVSAETAMPAFELTILGMLFFVTARLARWMMDLGYIHYARGTTRGEKTGYRNLFEGFNYFAKAIAIRIIRAVLVAVGFMLFFVPGLVLLCAFSQASWLLLDHPEKGVFWFLGESTRLMRGRKMEYFILRLSFIGWDLLATIPWLMHIVQFWLVPYLTFTRANYYHKITGREVPPPDGGWKKPGM